MDIVNYSFGYQIVFKYTNLISFYNIIYFFISFFYNYYMLHYTIYIFFKRCREW